jgi:hypothetical protein
MVSLTSPSESLHKGLGVRKDGLVTHLGSLAGRMHVAPGEPAHEVLAKVICHMTAVIGETTRDEKWATVLRVAYNLPQEPDFNQLILKDRLRWLAGRHGKGWETSTLNSKLSELRRLRVLPRLAEPFAPLAPEVVAEAAESERLYASRGGASGHQRILLPKDALGLMISETYLAGRRIPGYALPQVDLHFTVSCAGNLVTTATEDFGEVLAAFTDASLLRGFWRETGAPTSDRDVRGSGRKVISVLVRDGRTGLAVNPLGAHGVTTGMFWSPEELVEL